MTAQNKKARIPRNVVLLSFTSLLTDLSSEPIIAALPFFLLNVLGVATPLIGLIEGVADGAATGLRAVSGFLSDRLKKRKPIVFSGYALSGVSKALFYFAGSWVAVLVLRFADRVGKGMRGAPRDALVADSTPAAIRGRAFGLHRALDPLGAVLGLGAGAAIIHFFSPSAKVMSEAIFRTIVLASIAPALVCLIPLVFVRDVAVGARPQDEGKSGSGAEVKSPGGMVSKPFLIFLAVSVLFHLGNSSDAFLLLRTQTVRTPLPLLFLALAAFNLVTAASAYPVGALSDRIGRRKLILMGWTLYAAIYFGFGLVKTPEAALGLFVVYGAYYGALEPVSRAFIADLVPPERRASAYGVYFGCMGFALLAASVIAGWLWQHFSPAAPFFFGSGMAVAAAAAFGALARK